MDDWTIVAKKGANFGHGEPNEKLYRDRDWLYQKYWIEDLTLTEIGNLCDVTYTPIWLWLRKLNIPIKSLNYIHTGKTMPEGFGEKISRKLKGRISPFKGKHHTKLIKQILSERISGERHPQYGKTLEKSASWKGGRMIQRGYVYIYMPKHPAAHGGHIYIAEHRLIAEKALGRYLKSNEHIHHINFNRSDNRNKNFLICTKSYHAWLDRKIKRLDLVESFKNQTSDADKK